MLIYKIVTKHKTKQNAKTKTNKTSSEKISCHGLWSGKARRDFLNNTINPSSPIQKIRVVRLTKYWNENEKKIKGESAVIIHS